MSKNGGSEKVTKIVDKSTGQAVVATNEQVNSAIVQLNARFEKMERDFSKYRTEQGRNTKNQLNKYHFLKKSIMYLYFDRTWLQQDTALDLKFEDMEYNLNRDDSSKCLKLKIYLFVFENYTLVVIL